MSEVVATSPDVTAEISRWLSYLGAERRMSAKTLDAYRRDVSQFLGFLADHLGGAPNLKQLARLVPADIRAFMAARRRDGSGNRSLMRTLAGCRSFARFLERNGKGKVAALTAVSTPKLPRTLPKPLAASIAVQVTGAGLREGETREPWIVARDAAVLALLYGSGLRISEALGLKRKDFAASADALTVLGKGNKTRMVPLLRQVAKLITDYLTLCPVELAPEGPLFIGARRGNLSPRVVQLAMARLRGALGLSDSATPIYWRAVAICALSRSCWGTLRFRPRKSTRPSIPSDCWKFIRARIRALNPPSCTQSPFRSSLRHSRGRGQGGPRVDERTRKS